MSNVRQMLAERLRRAIESARNSYESQPYKHAVYRLSKTEWFSGAISELRNENPNAPQATLAEMLDVLTEHTEYLAEREARQIERTLDALGIELDARTQTMLTDLVHSWPWSSGAPMHGSTKDISPLLLGEITKRPGEKTNSDELHKVLRWARDALKPLPDAPPRGVLTVGGFDDELAFVSLTLPSEHDAPTPPINDKQLTALYYIATVPDGVRYAHSFFHLLERVASGDAERYLLEHVAPEALAKCEADNTQDARDALALAIRQHARQLRDALALNIPKDAAAADALALELYERSANCIEKTGSEGQATANIYRKNATARANKSTAEKWTPWRREGDSVPGWLLSLACVAWIDELERERNARPFALSTVQHAGDRYAKAPKMLAPISWAMGAPGMRAVKIDGDTYAPEPGVAAKLVPRSFALLSELVPDHARRPHQTALAIDHEEDSIALAVAVTGATNYAISPIAAKLALVMLASDSVRDGLLQRVPLGELARWVHPGAKKIQARELQATSSGVDELRGLFVFLPDGRKVQVFDAVSAATPELARVDMEIAWGFTSTFAAVLGSDIAGPSLTGAEYRGDFLVNLDGAMRISSKRPSLLRHYIRSAAHWNAAFKPGGRGEFDPSRLPTYTAEQWASITNSLPPGVVEYLGAAGKKASRAATSTHRAAWSKKRTEMMNDLAELEAMGLVLVEHKGRDGFQLLPPDVFLEAKNEAMTNGRRPDRGGNK